MTPEAHPGELLDRVQELSADVDELSDPHARELAHDLVGAVIAMYGDGLRRIIEAVGHSREAGATTLVLFHHDPDSTDRTVDTILRQAREEFDSVFAASEGMVITLGGAGDRVQAHMPGTRTALRREAQFRARICGVTEGGKPFEEETLVRDLSLQGALISLQHLPRLQSELQVTMETPGPDGLQTMRLRGYVVRIDAGTEKGMSAVGVVFTD